MVVMIKKIITMSCLWFMLAISPAIAQEDNTHGYTKLYCETLEMAQHFVSIMKSDMSRVPMEFISFIEDPKEDTCKFSRYFVLSFELDKKIHSFVDADNDFIEMWRTKEGKYIFLSAGERTPEA